MTEPRLSTVFDYSDLRLHPDGTRVYQKSTNLRPQIAKVTVRTSRNNWIARDAGGLANIRKYKSIEGASEDIQEDESFKTKTDSLKPENEEEVKERGKKRKTKRFDGRKAKRQKFLENYDYLTKDASTSSNLASDAGTESFPYEPSSDLLKCIHRYASEYYTESGQLLNISRDYRRQRKKKRDEKKAKDRGISSSPTNSRTSSPNDGSLGCESDTSSRDGEYEIEGDSEVDKGEFKENEKAKRKGRQRTAKQYRDMYKVFDGSAIMAIGVLIQEYIAEVLNPQPPGEWEEEVRKAFTTGCTSEDEGGAAGAASDDATGLAGSDSDGGVDSHEQHHGNDNMNKGGPSSRNDNENPNDKKQSVDDSSSTSPRSFVEDEVKTDPHDKWPDRWATSDRPLTGERVPETFQTERPPYLVDPVWDEDDPSELSSDESISSDDAVDPSAKDSD